MPAPLQYDQADLAALAQRASPEALQHLAKRHLDFVFGVARRATGGDHHLAEDVTQAVFIILSRRAAHVRADRLCSWLFTTTRNVAANAGVGRLRESQPSDRKTPGGVTSTPDHRTVFSSDKKRRPT
jgi:RNA polymerase sigma factor (sigma-70 family)